MFRSIGIYVFASPPPLMLPLGALLLLSVVIAGHARSSAVLAFRERQVAVLIETNSAPLETVLGRASMSTRQLACSRVCKAKIVASQAHLLGAGHAKLEMWKRQPPCSNPCWGLPKLQA